MKVLIIGGALYFGKVTVRKLLARGDDGTIFSRGNVRPEFWDDITHVQGDREQRDDFVDKVKDKEFDAVIDNLAFRVEDAQAVVKALQGRTGKYPWWPAPSPSTERGGISTNGPRSPTRTGRAILTSTSSCTRIVPCARMTWTSAR